MHLIINNNGFKHTVVFIHGFGKQHTDFNQTESGKDIHIETTITRTANTIMVQLELSDYDRSVRDVTDAIYNLLPEIDIQETTVVAHSNGSMYAAQLCESYNFNKLLLLDPPRISFKINGSPDLTIKNRAIVRVHLNIDATSNEDYLAERIKYFNKLTNKNTKSRLIIHWQTSHMIHYRISDVIVDSIKELIRC